MAEIKHTDSIAEPVLNVRAELGEGALWHPEEQKLYWVDIEGRALHIYDPASGADIQFPTGERISTVVPVAGGNVLVALQNGIHEMDIKTGSLTFIANTKKDPNVRFNDGKCDPAGRFWVGTKSVNKAKPEAVLYRMDHDKTIRLMLTGIFNSNGITWSADKKTMYYIDTPTLSVQAFDYDNELGTIKNGRVIIGIPIGGGFPDGMTIDEEDNLWIALWGVGTVAKYNPRTGKLLQTIKVPAPNTSSCAFGGRDLKTLYITTARIELSADILRQYPLSGDLFCFIPGVAGVKANFFISDRF
jgi:sugar lactone lactonase YvrE